MPPTDVPEVPDAPGSIELGQIGPGRFKATNDRGGVLPVGSGDDPDFTPTELLLAALAGCGALELADLLAPGSPPGSAPGSAAPVFTVRAAGRTVHDDQGSRLVGLQVTFDLQVPDGPSGDVVRGLVPDALRQLQQRSCAVGRTVTLGEPVEYVAWEVEPAVTRP